MGHNMLAIIFQWAPENLHFLEVFMIFMVKLRGFEVAKTFIIHGFWGAHGLYKGNIPSRKLTYPTWGKGKSSSNMPYQGDMLIPWRVIPLLRSKTTRIFLFGSYKTSWLQPPRNG